MEPLDDRRWSGEQARAAELQRKIIVLRWGGVLFSLVQILTYYRPYPAFAKGWALTLVALLAIANLAVWLGIRHRPLNAISLSRSGLLIDCLFVLGLVTVYSFDQDTSIWAVIYLLPLEAAAFFGLRAAALTMLASTVGYIGREFFAQIVYGHALLATSVSFRMGLGFLITGFAGSALQQVSDMLRRQQTFHREQTEIFSVMDVTSVARAVAHAALDLSRASGSQVLRSSGDAQLVLASAGSVPEEAEPELVDIEIKDVSSNRLAILRLNFDTVSTARQASADSILRTLADVAGIAMEHAMLVSETLVANQRKDLLLSRMSHELRTPLNAILGFAQLLDMETDDPAEKESLEQILKGGQTLLRLVDEVLGFTGTGGSEEPVTVEPIDVEACASEALQGSRSHVDRPDVTVTMDLTAGVVGVGDRRKVVGILQHLLDNALAYSQREGRVTVSSTIDGGMLNIDVADQGPGIDPDKLARLFEPFDRLGAEATGLEGSGLGLAVSRKLALQMEGSLELVENSERGCTFRLTILAMADPERKPEENKRTRSVTTVLYIEDNEANIKLVQRILGRRPELEFISAKTGREGLSLVDKRRPSLVLLDLNLPDISGREVLSRLRQTENGTPIVMLTADASATTAQELLNKGAARVISKPLDIELLLSTVAELTSA